ncbi:hypothetical protein D3C77_733640 [compost metagenome]
MFMDLLPSDQVIPALQQRLDSNLSLLNRYKQTPVHGMRTGVNLAVEHKLTMLEAEVAFLEQAITTLRSNL